MKSSDGGNTLEKLAFYGESDFHNLAVGYNTEAIYLYNERPNSKLQQGFYFSTNNGQDWKNSKLKVFQVRFIPFPYIRINLV